MKTKLTLAVLCCLSTFFAFGQTVPFPTDTVIDTSVPFSEKMDDVFGNLDLSDVSTDLLLDRAWPFAKPADFDGTVGADTVKSHKHWLKLYGTMFTAAISQPTPIPSINDWKAQRDSEEAAGKNPLVIMHIDYQQFLTDSVLLSTLIYENNGKLEDYPNQFLLDLIDSVGYNSAAPKSNIVGGFDPLGHFSGCPLRHGYTK